MAATQFAVTHLVVLGLLACIVALFVGGAARMAMGSLLVLLLAQITLLVLLRKPSLGMPVVLEVDRPPRHIPPRSSSSATN